MTIQTLSLPLRKQDALSLRAGDMLSLSGTLYTARDAAHKRLCALLEAGQPLPFDISGQTLYYVGPAPAGEGRVIGSAGPTSSYRMDAYTPALLDAGLIAMIGKGRRSPEVKRALCDHGAVYLGTVGGAGALLARCITACEIVAYPDLLSEAVRRLTVREFPAIVLCDAFGGDLYETGAAEYRAPMEQWR